MVDWQDGMVFEGYIEGEHVVSLDAEEEFGGQGRGTRPKALLLTSLAGCTAMDVISILRKKRQEIVDLKVEVTGTAAEEHPKVYTHIQVTYLVTGRNVDPAAVERAIELSMTRYCPVANLLKHVVPIETSYQIIEA
ncbi:MAG: OsmC family protein [Anaerolineae bacterium]